MKDNLPALMAALGLPPSLAETFPKRAETVRKVPNLNGAATLEKDAATSLEAVRKGLRAMYGEVISEITQNPAVLVV